MRGVSHQQSISYRLCVCRRTVVRTRVTPMTESETGTENVQRPRLAPIERPKGFMMRLAYWGMRRQFGKVMTPVKVMSARVPESLKPSAAIVKFSMKGLRLDPALVLLIGDLASQINGCTFCLDLGRAMALRSNLDMGKFDALMDYKTNALFTERERAALAYAEEATRNKRVADATFENLRKHCTEREIVEITWANAIENFYNLTNLPLGIGSDGFCLLQQAKARTAADRTAGGEPTKAARSP